MRSLRFLAAVALAVGPVMPAAALDTWRYLDNGDVKIFGTTDANLTVVLSCTTEKISAAFTINGSDASPLIDAGLAPGDGRVPVSILVTVDSSDSVNHADAYAITITKRLAMVYLDGKPGVYALAEQLGSAGSRIKVEVTYKGHPLAPQAVDAVGLSESAQTWMSACDALS